MLGLSEHGFKNGLIISRKFIQEGSGHHPTPIKSIEKLAMALDHHFDSPLEREGR